MIFSNLSINFPEFTQFVQLMNWQNNLCKFVSKIVQSFSKRITCTQPESSHKLIILLIFQGKGDWNEATFKKNQEVMANLWNEIAELADFNKVN